MGRFIYGTQRTRIEIEDRALAHLQRVIGNKLRRNERFFFSWKEDVSVGGGRRTVWVHHGADLEFAYYGSRTPSMSRDWLEALNTVANSSTGLYLVPEPAPRSSRTPDPLAA
ncbi:DUF7882 family protein [Microbacterium radiodurans]|uniref:ATP-dependent DNA ligase n=1 Tax=Microbacterium radiodurans TaxID=661398 RepID=A0A5J5INC9_9MICO|nr:ATP-dependent DNA ligase [Microbacterium radiodurans]KAA9084952.1 ATP-dependent DNA ligase [Microbacterium radiodurans]